MAHPLLDDFDDRIWSQHNKATLEAEIEWGYQEIKDFPLVEGSLKSHKQKNKTREETNALKRLGDMYEDPQIGPDFFLKTTKMIRNSLRQYRLCKNNPTEFGRFFHCSSPSSGIILHFNSVAAKKEIFVLLPAGDLPRQKPAKIQIAHIIKWHKNRKIKALTTRLEELKAMGVLWGKLLQTQLDLTAVLSSNKDRLADFLKECSEVLSLENDTMNIAAKKLQYEKVIEKVVECSTDREDIVKLREDFDALNPRMYDEKDFIQMRIDHCKTLTRYYSYQGKQLENVLSTIEEKI